MRQLFTPSTKKEIAPTLPEISPSVKSSRFGVLDVLLIGSMFIWATNYSVIKASLDVLPPFVFNLFRFIIGTITLTIFVKLSGEKLVLPRSEWRPIIVLGLLGNIIYQTLYLTGLHNTTVAHSVLITTVAPIGLVVINMLRGKDQRRRSVWLGIALALGGVIVVIFSRFALQLDFAGTMLYGDLVTVTSIGVWVANTMALQGPLMRNSALVVSLWILAWGTVFTGLIALPDLVKLDWSVLRPDVVRGLFYSGIISIGIAGTIFNYGIRRLGTSRTAIYLNLQPVFAALVAAAFLNEKITIWLVIGAFMVLTGMGLVRRG